MSIRGESRAEVRREYERRRDQRREDAGRQQRRHIAIGNWRLILGLTGATLVWVAFALHWLSGWWVLPPVLAFIVLAVLHEQVLRRRRYSDRAATYYDRGLARLEDRWMGAGETGERFLDESHPYARDLDIFGKGSLFELISTARTRAGEEILAAWLSAPAPLEEIRARQESIDELRPRLDFREDLAVLGEDVRLGVHPGPLAAWGEAPPLVSSRRERALAAILPCLLSISLAAWVAFGARGVFLLALVAQAGFALRLRPKVLRALQEVDLPSHDLALLSEVLVRLERQQFRSVRLARLRAELDTEGLPPSRRIARLKRLTELIDSREHWLVRLIGPWFLWGTNLAFAVEAWRKHYGPAVRRWLQAVGEMEALSALAGYAYERPEDPFAEFDAEAPCFEAEGAGHPLLPESRLVRNDVRLDGDLRVLVVSGSNMSGKTTLLRTVGVNAVLALAGAPVRCRRLRISPLTVGACIRLQDSLQAGVSRFYAEITRVRRLVDLTGGPAPLLFLLDELLHGTNSHDRRIGAEAIVRELVRRGGVGLVTTHDLALAHIAHSLAPHAANVHFEDHLENGKMTFDYRLRPGVVTKSNALELMRSVGLEV